MDMSTVRRSVRPVVVFIAFTALTACGGGARAVPSAPAAPTGTGASSAERGTASFVIAVPSRTAAASARRRPAYISPATQSIKIALTGPTATTQTANLTPTSTGCTSTLATTQCTLSLALTPGSYTGTISTYDGANATGTMLSGNQNVAFTIATGQANTISLTLDGIPHQVLITAQSAGAKPTGGASFAVSGIAPASLLATALDADGNIIVGPGAPTFTVTQTGGSSYTIGNPTTTSPNTFTLLPPAGNGATAAFTLTAAFGDTTCSQSGAVCTASFTTTAHQQTLIVENSNTITVYAWPYTGTPTTLSGYSSPAGLPQIAAFDGSGNLFIGDNNAGNVKEYAPPYTGAPVATIGGGTLADVIPVVMGPNGTLFVGGFNNNAVYAYAPPYTGAPTVISNGINGPAEIAFDGSGNLFVANFRGSRVTEYAPPYTGAPTMLGSVSQALQVTAAASGTAFAISPGANSINVFTPPYTGGATQLTADVNSVGVITVGPDGSTLFVGQTGSSRIDLYQPPYTAVSSRTSGMSANDPQSLAFDAANDLFSANLGNDTVTIYVPPYTGTPRTVSSGISVPSGVFLSP